ncbi:MAG: 4a-hydroxytetrahydrobiopterin dehydratase [Phycisphaerales bacterium]
MKKLSDEQVRAGLEKLPEWSASGGKITRTYQFEDFVQSMRFVDQVASAAEADQHHPDILIRYNKVTLTLSTHDAHGITKKDFALAHKADDFAGHLVA